MARRAQWRVDYDLSVLRQWLGYGHCCSLRRVTENLQGKPSENKSPEIPVHIAPIPIAPHRGRVTLPKQGCLTISAGRPLPQKAG